MTLTPTITTEHSCWLCADPVHQIALSTDEWGWAGRDGSITATSSEFRHLPEGDPYARLRWLDERMTTLHALPKSQRTPETATEDNRLIKEYVALKVRMEMSLSFHVHVVPGSQVPVDERARRTVVLHCDYPAWRRPSGWECRMCHVHLGTDEEVGFI